MLRDSSAAAIDLAIAIDLTVVSRMRSYNEKLAEQITGEATLLNTVPELEPCYSMSIHDCCLVHCGPLRGAVQIMLESNWDASVIWARTLLRAAGRKLSN